MFLKTNYTDSGARTARIGGGGFFKKPKNSQSTNKVPTQNAESQPVLPRDPNMSPTEVTDLTNRYENAVRQASNQLRVNLVGN